MINLSSQGNRHVSTNAERQLLQNWIRDNKHKIAFKNLKDTWQYDWRELIEEALQSTKITTTLSISAFRNLITKTLKDDSTVREILFYNDENGELVLKKRVEKVRRRQNQEMPQKPIILLADTPMHIEAPTYTESSVPEEVPDLFNMSNPVLGLTITATTTALLSIEDSKNPGTKTQYIQITPGQKITLLPAKS